MLPIPLLAFLHFMNLSLLRRHFPQFEHENSRVLDNFYDLLIYQPYYGEMLAKVSLSVFLCSRLIDIRVGKLSFSEKMKSKMIQSMMKRIIFSRRFNHSLDSCMKINRFIPMRLHSALIEGHTNTIIFHELFPIMAVCSLSCYIFRIQKDLSTFDQVSSVHTDYYNLFLSGCFHRKLPILALGGYNGIVQICSMNMNGTNVTTLCTFQIKQGSIWSLMFHPTLPILFVSTERSGNVIILYFTKDFRRLRFDQISMRIHENTINSIKIQKDSRFLLTTSEDNSARISTFESNFRVLVLTSVLQHTYRVSSGVIHQYLPLVATGSDDNYAKIWNVSDINNPQCIRKLRHSSAVRCLHFGLGFTLFTGSYSGSVSLWNIEGEDVVPERPAIVGSFSNQDSILSIGLDSNNPKIIVVGDSRKFTSYQLE